MSEGWPGLLWPLWFLPAGSTLADWAALACAPAFALAIDRLLGEPALRWHPVVWMGRWLHWAGVRLAPAADLHADLAPGPRRQFWAAAGAWCGMSAFIFASAWLLQSWVLSMPGWLAALALGLFLKPFMAWALLHDEVLAVEHALAHGLPQGQQQLARLVSRDVRQLSPAEVRESAIESLAENLNDSLVAPLFWFALLGLPGAALYRFANTADAMWGYPGAYPLAGVPRQWRWAGKWAARADDVLSWLPARLTALLLALLAPLPATCWRALPRAARQTPSPNGGWPMGAMALALDVRLGKPGSYTLNPQAPPPEPAHTLRACALGSRTALAATLLCCASVLAMLCLL